MNRNTSARRYRHVVIVGIDGMGSFCQNTETPCMDAIFQNGAKTTDAQSMFPTISAQNWGAMLLGAAPEIHGLTNGGISQTRYHSDDLPSIFATVREAYPDAVLCSVSNWAPINGGIIEDDRGVEMQETKSGEETTDKAVTCIKARRPDLLFIHIDDPDEAGHHFGYGTEGHLQCITRVDAMVGRIFDACRDAGMLNDTLFLSITDHGGFKRGHGGYTDGEKYIFFALRGKTVCKTKGFFALTRDVNAIVRYAFGLEIPAKNDDGYSSQVPQGVFCDWDRPYLRDPEGARIEITPQPQPDFHSEKGLAAFFPEEQIKLAMFFEYDAADATGNARFREEGHVKFYGGGVRGAYAEFGATGCLYSDDVRFGKDDFTVCAWLKVDGAPVSEAYYCGTKTMTDSGAGFALGFTKIATWLGMETPDPASYQEHITPYFRDVSGGWMHVAFAFHRQENTIVLFQNFKYKRTFTLPAYFAAEPMDALPFTVGDEASHKINTGNDALVCMDDLLIFNKAFEPDDLQTLAAYYQFEP